MARYYSSRFQSERINSSDALQVPIYENDEDLLDGEDGEMMYIEGQMQYFYNGSWQNIKVKRRDGSSAASAALSATELKSTLGTNAVNGSYWYQFNDGSQQQLWTDFTSYAPYNFVMVQRTSNTTNIQYQTGSLNPTDLALAPNDTAPTQVAKLSDLNQRDITTSGTVRWVIAGAGQVWYKMTGDPDWYSDFGVAGCCSCNNPNFYDGYAAPNSAPTWETGLIHNGGCGGGQNNAGGWLTLSGIHVNDNNYLGGYNGGQTPVTATPSPYLCGGGTGWGVNGYVLMSW